MALRPMAETVAERLRRAAQKLGTPDPVNPIAPLLSRTFALPEGDPRYARNALTPGAAPIEPSYSELRPGDLRFTVEPLGPDALPQDRRDEATREMRRLVRDMFGRDAVNWFDARSEAWRGVATGSRLTYGAFFGNAYDRDGLYSSKVYYETLPEHIDALPIGLFGLVSAALRLMPSLKPVFTTIACHRRQGGQRITFAYRGGLKLTELQPLLDELDLGHQLPGIMQIMGLALGGRFDLPERSVLLALGQTDDGPEFELYVLLGALSDVPGNFLDLLAMGLGERPRELNALLRWLNAFTPDDADWPGRFSVLSVRTTRNSPPRVSLYLRPVEFEVQAPVIGNGNGSEVPVAA